MRLLGLWLCCSLSLASVSAQTCYNPDGSTAGDDVACSGSSSSCCPAGSTCYENGLCAVAGVTTRASCTDQTWTAKYCSTACINQNKTSSVSLTPCGNTTFACGISANCNEPQMVYSISMFNVLHANVSSPSSTPSAIPTVLLTNGTHSGSCYINGQKIYTTSTILIVGLSLGFPLLIAVIACTVMFWKMRKYATSPSLSSSHSRKDMSLDSKSPDTVTSRVEYNGKAIGVPMRPQTTNSQGITQSLVRQDTMVQPRFVPDQSPIHHYSSPQQQQQLIQQQQQYDTRPGTSGTERTLIQPHQQPQQHEMDHMGYPIQRFELGSTPTATTGLGKALPRQPRLADLGATGILGSRWR